MLVLALLSIALLIWEAVTAPDAVTRHRITIADDTICLLFLLEFLYRWHLEGWRRSFPLKNWYDILGMIPVSSAALRGLRLFRVVRVVILLSRFGMAADRAVGEEFTYRLVNRFRRAIVDAVADTVTLAVMDEVSQVLHLGTYTRNIAGVLESREAPLRGMIRDQLARDPRAGRLARLPFFNDIVDAVLDSGLHVVHGVLVDPRTDALVADMLASNFTQLREAIRMNNLPKAVSAAPSTPASVSSPA